MVGTDRVNELTDALFGLSYSHINTSSLLCDCHLSWLSVWLRMTSVNVVNVTSLRCAHPSSVHGRSFTDVTVDQLICGMIHRPG